MRHFTIIVFILLAYPGLAQNKSELSFIEHLVNKGDFNEVIHLIDHDTILYGKAQLDSLYYYQGWAHYSLKNLEQSTISLLNVSKESSFYSKSRFFAGYNQIFLTNYEDALKIFSQLDFPDEKKLSLVNFELSGIDMLQENYKKANEKLKQIDPNFATLNQPVIALGQINQKLETRHPKSPLLAGLMSAIVPGAGKIYVGKPGEGIASMLATVGFGLITIENYRKLGLNNFKTLFFGSIFAANYVSNIYGSVISVKIIENNYKDAIHNQILFQLHVPLRNFFE